MSCSPATRFITPEELERRRPLRDDLGFRAKPTGLAREGHQNQALVDRRSALARLFLLFSDSSAQSRPQFDLGI